MSNCSNYAQIKPATFFATSSISSDIYNCCCTTNPLNTVYVTLNGLCNYTKRICYDFNDDRLVHANDRFMIHPQAAKLYTKSVDISEIDTSAGKPPHYILYNDLLYAVQDVYGKHFAGLNLITCESEMFYLIPDTDGHYYVDEIFSADEEIQKDGLRITTTKYAKLKAEEANRNVNL